MTTKRWMEGRTKRYHTWPIIGEQTVADHSWGAAQILLDIWPDCSKELLVAVLDHDRMEKYTGDVPSPTKWDYPALAEALDEVEDRLNHQNGIHLERLSAEDFHRLRAVDLLELIAFASYQTYLGNVFATKVYVIGLQKLMDLTKEMGDIDRYAVEQYVKRFHQPPEG